MLAFSSLQASAAIFMASQLWIQLGWTDGSGAVIMVAIASCFFAALDEPAPMMRTFLIWARGQHRADHRIAVHGDSGGLYL
jgi:uncharacterized membrane protein YccC